MNWNNEVARIVTQAVDSPVLWPDNPLYPIKLCQADRAQLWVESVVMAIKKLYPDRGSIVNLIHVFVDAVPLYDNAWLMGRRDGNRPLIETIFAELVYAVVNSTNTPASGYDSTLLLAMVRKIVKTLARFYEIGNDFVPSVVLVREYLSLLVRLRSVKREVEGAYGRGDSDFWREIDRLIVSCNTPEDATLVSAEAIGGAVLRASGL